MADALGPNRQLPMVSPTRFLGSVFVALLIASGLEAAIASAQQATTVVLTKFANSLLKLNFPGATVLRESPLDWGTLTLLGLGTLTTLAAAFLVASWLYPTRGQQAPTDR